MFRKLFPFAGLILGIALLAGCAREYFPPEVTTPRFNVWKTIKLGTGPKTVEDFRRAFRDGGFKFDPWLYRALEERALTVATEETEADLVVVSVAELGFKQDARDQIYPRAIYKRAKKRFGLELCPAEVAPQLRLQYLDQPKGESLYIAYDTKCNVVLSVERDGWGLQFGYYWANWRVPAYFRDADTQWIFCLPK